MKKVLKKTLVALATHKEVVAASSVALAGLVFVVLGDPWDADHFLL